MSAPKSKSQLLRARTQQANCEATLAEVFSDLVTDAAGTAFAVSHLKAGPKPVLWVQDRLSRKETGRPYLAGLPNAIHLIHVNVSTPRDLLWAMEEGLRCPDLGGVIGEVWGDPAVLDFTATKRLALRSEAHNVPAWLIRHAGHANLSAARLRWRIGSLPAMNNPYDAHAPGAPLWKAELFRARWRTPGEWVVNHDGKDLHFDHGIARPAAPEHREAM